jgi:hypothetical protein
MTDVRGSSSVRGARCAVDSPRGQMYPLRGRPHRRGDGMTRKTSTRLDREIKAAIVAAESEPDSGDRPPDASEPRPGRYRILEDERRRRQRALYANRDEARDGQLRAGLRAAQDERDRYLRDLLSRLPFSWRVEHNFAIRETPNYGGADHVVVTEEVRIGRLSRRTGDALSAPRSRFRGLHPVEENRLPNSTPDIEVAERIVASASRDRK